MNFRNAEHFGQTYRGGMLERVADEVKQAGDHPMNPFYPFAGIGFSDIATHQGVNLLIDAPIAVSTRILLSTNFTRQFGLLDQ